MAFKVSSVLTGVYTRRAERDIKKLESNTKERVGKALLRYSEEPLKFAEKLSDPILGEYRFRVGDYRVIFGRRVPLKPLLVGGVKGHNMKENTFPGSPALWAGSFPLKEMKLLF